MIMMIKYMKTIFILFFSFVFYENQCAILSQDVIGNVCKTTIGLFCLIGMGCGIASSTLIFLDNMSLLSKEINIKGPFLDAFFGSLILNPSWRKVFSEEKKKINIYFFFRPFREEGKSLLQRLFGFLAYGGLTVSCGGLLCILIAKEYGS